MSLSSCWDTAWAPSQRNNTCSTTAGRSTDSSSPDQAPSTDSRLASSVPAGKNILNVPFEPARSPFDWLSRDSAVVDAFMNDPLCFAQLQPAANASFFAAALRLSDPVSLRKIRNDLPIYLFSGSEDPVGQQLDGVQILIERYHKAGLRDISHDFYPGGRHEMLNEINRGDVLAHLLGWMSAMLERQERWPESPSAA